MRTHSLLIAALLLGVVVAPGTARADSGDLAAAATPTTLEWGLELGGTTRWHLTDSARNLGLGTEGGSTLAVSVANDTWRGELLWRSEEGDGNLPNYDYVETLEHQYGAGIARRLLDRDWIRLEARAAVTVVWRRVIVSGGGASVEDRAIRPGLEVGFGSEWLLPRRLTRDRFRAGVRLELGYQHVVGFSVQAKLKGARPAGSTTTPLALGTWSESGPMLRSGIVVRF